MQKVYFIHNVWSEDDVQFLAKFGIVREVGDNESVRIKDDRLYYELHDYLSKSDKRGGYYREYYGYEYSKEDIMSSDYCVMRVMSRRGYPQPESDHELWRSKAYDMSRLCMKCGQEEHQIGEFWISQRPKKPLWTFTSWNIDSVFLTEELYKSEFEPLGIGCLNVRDRRGRILQGVLQLDIPVIDEDLDLSMHHNFEICPKCGKKKYRASYHFPFFPLHEHPLPHIYYTKEHFGSGGEAFREIVVSIELAKRLMELKLANHWCFIPCRKNLAEYLKTIKY